jgi:hypothetical protein
MASGLTTSRKILYEIEEVELLEKNHPFNSRRKQVSYASKGWPDHKRTRRMHARDKQKFDLSTCRAETTLQTYTQIYAHTITNLTCIRVRVRPKYTELITASSGEEISQVG